MCAGNYILSEVLYFTKLFPWIKCGELTDDVITTLYYVICRVCRYSYESQKPKDIIQKSSVIQKAVENTENVSENTEEVLSIYNDEVKALSEVDIIIPYPFEFSVYSRSRSPDGRVVVKETGPHKRSVHWVPELQVIGKSTP